MILLNSGLCSNNFRKVGIIHSCINIFFQIICLLLLVISINNQSKYYNAILTKILIVALFFNLLDIVFYSLLIYGLVSRNPTILILWLSFAPLELIIVQASLFYFVYAVTVLASSGVGIVALIGDILLSSFMFHNMCVVFSARHGFIRNQRAQTRAFAYPQVNATTFVTNSTSPVPYSQFNPQHLQYNATTSQFLPCKCIYPHRPPNCQMIES